MLTFAFSNRGVEQLVARRAHNPEAGGSSPSPATKQDTSFEVSFFVLMKGHKSCNNSADFSRIFHIFVRLLHCGHPA